MMRRWMAAALCAAMLLCGLPRAAISEDAHSLTLTLLNDWVVARGNATVYRDPEMTRPWGQLPGFMILQRRYDLQNGCTAVANGKYCGYIATDDLMMELWEGDWLCAARDTRAYQGPSLNSRWVKVKQGLPVQLVSISGSCAKVRRGNIVAYMYIGHLKPITTAIAV